MDCKRKLRAPGGPPRPAGAARAPACPAWHGSTSRCASASRATTGSSHGRSTGGATVAERRSVAASKPARRSASSRRRILDQDRKRPEVVDPTAGSRADARSGPTARAGGARRGCASRSAQHRMRAAGATAQAGWGRAAGAELARRAEGCDTAHRLRERVPRRSSPTGPAARRSSAPSAGALLTALPALAKLEKPDCVGGSDIKEPDSFASRLRIASSNAGSRTCASAPAGAVANLSGPKLNVENIRLGMSCVTPGQGLSASSITPPMAARRRRSAPRSPRFRSSTTTGAVSAALSADAPRFQGAQHAVDSRSSGTGTSSKSVARSSPCPLMLSTEEVSAAARRGGRSGRKVEGECAAERRDGRASRSELRVSIGLEEHHAFRTVAQQYSPKADPARATSTSREPTLPHSSRARASTARRPALPGVHSHRYLTIRTGRNDDAEPDSTPIPCQSCRHQPLPDPVSADRQNLWPRLRWRQRRPSDGDALRPWSVSTTRAAARCRTPDRGRRAPEALRPRHRRSDRPRRPVSAIGSGAVRVSTGPGGRRDPREESERSRYSLRCARSPLRTRGSSRARGAPRRERNGSNGGSSWSDMGRATMPRSRDRRHGEHRRAAPVPQHQVKILDVRRRISSLQGAFLLEDHRRLGPTMVSERVRTHRVVGSSGFQSRLDVGAEGRARSHRPRGVALALELEQVRAGAGGALLLVVEPGHQQYAPGGRAAPNGSPPAASLARVPRSTAHRRTRDPSVIDISAHVRVEEADTEPRRRARIESRARSVTIPSATSRRLVALLSGPDTSTNPSDGFSARSATSSASVAGGLVKQLGRDRPLMLVVEDLALDRGPSTLKLSAVRRSAQARLRCTSSPMGRIQGMGVQPSGPQIGLHRLARRQDRRRSVRRIREDQELPGGLARRSGGEGRWRAAVRRGADEGRPRTHGSRVERDDRDRGERGV